MGYRTFRKEATMSGELEVYDKFCKGQFKSIDSDLKEIKTLLGNHIVHLDKKIDKRLNRMMYALVGVMGGTNITLLATMGIMITRVT